MLLSRPTPSLGEIIPLASEHKLLADCVSPALQERVKALAISMIWTGKQAIQPALPQHNLPPKELPLSERLEWVVVESDPSGRVTQSVSLARETCVGALFPCLIRGSHQLDLMGDPQHPELAACMVKSILEILPRRGRNYVRSLNLCSDLNEALAYLRWNEVSFTQRMLSTYEETPSPTRVASLTESEELSETASTSASEPSPVPECLDTSRPEPTTKKRVTFVPPAPPRRAIVSSKAACQPPSSLEASSQRIKLKSILVGY